MAAKVIPDSIYVPSEGVVAREIEGEMIIVPLIAGIGDADDELFTLNDTGKAIWKQLDGQRSLKNIVENLSAEFESQPGEIERDVTGLVEELLKRKMLVEVPKA
jgi:hypothetical protein